MPAPPYMRFFVDDYCNATISLTIEEQGAYMRLLCAMWKHGGKVVHDDAVIAKILPIHINKWRKIKPRLMPFLSTDEEGHLLQSRLVAEYQFSAGDKKGTKSSTHGVTPT